MKILIVTGLFICAAAVVALLARSRNDAPKSTSRPITHSENQSWVVRRGGEIVEKKSQSGISALSDWERLMYCLWVTDYMMRNAGDFANAVDMYPDFQKDAKHYAGRLNLPTTSEAFSLSTRKLQKAYFDRFEAICNEVRGAEPSAAPNGGPAASIENLNAPGGPPSVS